MDHESAGELSQDTQAASPKRQFRRVSCRLRLRCRRFKGVGLYSTDETYVEGMVRNHSKGGFLLETPVYFPHGGKLEIAFNSPSGKELFMGVVTVKWVKRVGQYFRVGCSTDELQRM